MDPGNPDDLYLGDHCNLEVGKLSLAFYGIDCFPFVIAHFPVLIYDFQMSNHHTPLQYLCFSASGVPRKNDRMSGTNILIEKIIKTIAPI